MRHRSRTPRFPPLSWHGCTSYNARCGIPAFLRTGCGLIFVTAGTIGAVVVPAPLAVQLPKRLKLALPVIINQPTGRRTTWTFLTAPIPTHVRHSPHTAAVLHRSGANMVAEGAEIVLPSPDDPARRWHGAGPTDRYRPSPTSILAALNKR
ncbi:hypothetical protein IU487_14195 [Nocardia puris]|uniref:hypothetical protein n=1 Tax=Nocardia puris TaxID=208602 RepID=UPI001894F3CC|nr:hypothetical protein [Nocardia puris]MBF6212184.1 hypothetical protein [Nocardia puris]